MKPLISRVLFRIYLFISYKILGIITFIKTDTGKEIGWVYLKEYQGNDLDFVKKYGEKFPE